MEVTVKKLAESRVEISATLPWSEWGKHEAHAVEHMAANLELPGFRKGKIPKNIIEQRFGRQALLIEMAEHAVEAAYPKAILDAKAEAIGRPEIKFEKVTEGDALAFTLTTAVLPEIVLKKWEKAVTKVNKENAAKKIEVADADIDKEIERLATMRASFITVNRAAQKDDSVEIDFTVLQNGVPIEGGVGKKHPLVIGSGAFIPGFEEALIGMSLGDEKTVELTFPTEYHAEHLAGKPATFTVKMLLVQERHIPVVDDAFVKNLGRFETLVDLRKSIREGMLEERKREHIEAHRGAILDALFNEAELEYPRILVEQEETQMLSQFKTQIEGMGFTWERYLEQSKKTEEQLKQDWELQAKKRIAAELILQKLAGEKDIMVDNEDIEAEMNKVLQYYKSVKGIEKNLDLQRLYASVQNRLMNEKVLVWLEKL